MSPPPQFWHAALAIGLLGLLVLALAAVARRLFVQAAQRDQRALREERARIDAFLALRRIALVGVSRSESDFSRLVMRALQAHYVDVVPIHPTAAFIGEQLAYSTIAELQLPVQGALIMAPRAASAAIVEDCACAGVQNLWFHRGLGDGSASPEALAVARRHRMRVVADRCVMMFLEPSRLSIHRAHGVALRVLGRYPHCDPAQAGSTDA
jgi:uncharacterized protein